MRTARLPDDDTVRRLRLSALQGQIHPHFLNNALVTIQAFVREHPLLAEEMLGTLGQFVRAVLRLGAAPVTVAEELALVRVYLGLERVRLGRRLRTVFDIEPATLRLRLPALLLQPLVENAVVHAAAAQTGGATIRLAARYRGKRRRLVLMVADDGPGFPHPPAPPTATAESPGDAGAPLRARNGAPLGLRNLRLRLEAFYGSGVRLRLLRRPGGGAIAVLALPLGPVAPTLRPHAGHRC